MQVARKTSDVSGWTPSRADSSLQSLHSGGTQPGTGTQPTSTPSSAATPFARHSSGDVPSNVLCTPRRSSDTPSVGSALSGLPRRNSDPRLPRKHSQQVTVVPPEAENPLENPEDGEVLPGLPDQVPRRPQPGARQLRWRRGACVGAGTFGEVFIGLNEATGQLLAIKALPWDEADRPLTQRLAALQGEVRALRGLRHPNLVSYLCTQLSEAVLCIFMEYVPGGSLLSVTKQVGALSEETAARYAQSIADALCFLHRNLVVHRDVKAANVLVSVSGVLKLTDFGTAVFIKDDGSAKGLSSSVFWMAPEVLSSGVSGYPCDVWSLGCTLLEMLTAQLPFAHVAADEGSMASFLTHESPFVTLPPELHHSDECGNFLLQACLVPNAEARCTAQELLRHSFLLSCTTPTDDDGVEEYEEQYSVACVSDRGSETGRDEKGAVVNPLTSGRTVASAGSGGMLWSGTQTGTTEDADSGKWSMSEDDRRVEMRRRSGRRGQKGPDGKRGGSNPAARGEQQRIMQRVMSGCLVLTGVHDAADTAQELADTLMSETLSATHTRHTAVHSNTVDPHSPQLSTPSPNTFSLTATSHTLTSVTSFAPPPLSAQAAPADSAPTRVRRCVPLATVRPHTTPHTPQAQDCVVSLLRQHLQAQSDVEQGVVDMEPEPSSAAPSIHVLEGSTGARSDASRIYCHICGQAVTRTVCRWPSARTNSANLHTVHSAMRVCLDSVHSDFCAGCHSIDYTDLKAIHLNPTPGFHFVLVLLPPLSTPSFLRRRIA